MNESIQKEQSFSVKLRSFDSKILYMNGMYRLPIAPYPSVEHLNEQAYDRIGKFKDVLIEECKEIDEIHLASGTIGVADIDVLTNLADLLGDIVVYCYSEAAKFGIPLSEVLHIIMDSNFSKLGADGNPIYDERGKVQKGPFYWKPEGKIKALLLEHIEQAKLSRGIITEETKTGEVNGSE